MDFKIIAQLCKYGVDFAPTEHGLTRSTAIGWPSLATNDREVIKKWIKQDGYESLVAVAKRGHSYMLDIDDPVACNDLGFKPEWLHEMYGVSTPSGGQHWYGIQDDSFAELPSIVNVKHDNEIILELKIDRCSVAAPTAQRINQPNRKDGTYEPISQLNGHLRKGIHPELLSWIKSKMIQPKPVFTAKAVDWKFHPEFDMDQFLEDNHSSLRGDGRIDSLPGTLCVVPEECPICGAVNQSTIAAAVCKFLFGGKSYGFICQKCEIRTRDEYEEKMSELHNDFDPWSQYAIYEDDDLTLTAKRDKELLCSTFDVDFVEPIEDAAPPDTVEPSEIVSTTPKPKNKLREISFMEDDEGDRWGLMVKNAADIDMTVLKWLWPDRIPAGKITLYTGKPDCGKTLALLDLVARVSSGADFPDGSKNVLGPKKVLLAASEDDPTDTLIPRLVAAGATLSNIDIIWCTSIKFKNKNGEGYQKARASTFDLKDHLKMLLGAIKANPNIALLALDPFTSFVGNTDLNKDKEIRPLMDELKKLCEKSGITLVGLIHSNKRSDVDAVQKVMGASAVAGGARAVWGFSRDKQDKAKFSMALVKGNLARKRTGLGYGISETMVDIEGHETSVPRIEWGAEIESDAEDLLTEERQKAREGIDTKLATAIKFLESLTYPILSRNVYNMAEQKDISEITLRRAKNKLGIQAQQRSQGWYLYSAGMKPQEFEEKAVDQEEMASAL